MHSHKSVINAQIIAMLDNCMDENRIDASIARLSANHDESNCAWSIELSKEIQRKAILLFKRNNYAEAFTHYSNALQICEKAIIKREATDLFVNIEHLRFRDFLRANLTVFASLYANHLVEAKNFNMALSVCNVTLRNEIMQCLSTAPTCSGKQGYSSILATLNAQPKSDKPGAHITLTCKKELAELAMELIERHVITISPTQQRQ